MTRTTSILLLVPFLLGNSAGALGALVPLLIGAYCIFADNPFSWLFGQYGTAIEVVK